MPFALPTIVAGLVMLTLYGPKPGRHRAAPTRRVVVALLFVTLPFVVRTVQPVLMAMDRDIEEAAASLGAGPLTMFRRIVLPTLVPAIAAGAALAFARAIGEYGSLVLISGNLPFRTEVASSIFAYRSRTATSPRRRDRDRPAGRGAARHRARSTSPALGGPPWLAPGPRGRTAGRRPRRPVAAAVRSRRRRGARWALRAVAVVYIGSSSAVPLALVFQRTFADGAGAFWTRSATPDAVHAFKITASIALSRSRSTPSSASGWRCCWSATGSPAGGSQRAASTCRSRSRRSSSASP